MAEYVYLGHNNTIVLLLKVGGVAQDLSAVTRMTLAFGSTVIDSAVSSAAFDWASGATGELILALGGESIPAGDYGGADSVELVAYDPSNTDGIVWGAFACIVE